MNVVIKKTNPVQNHNTDKLYLVHPQVPHSSDFIVLYHKNILRSWKNTHHVGNLGFKNPWLWAIVTVNNIHSQRDCVPKIFRLDLLWIRHSGVKTYTLTILIRHKLGHKWGGWLLSKVWGSSWFWDGTLHTLCSENTKAFTEDWIMH